MYGDYFDGPRCAEFCFSSKGAGEPDCNKPDTVGKFLKIMEKFRLNQAKNQRHREQDTIYPNSYDPDNNNNVWKRQNQEQNQLKLSRWFFVWIQSKSIFGYQYEFSSHFNPFYITRVDISVTVITFA